MNSSEILLLGFLLVISISIFLGYLARRGKEQTLKGFFWGNHKLTPRQAAHLTISTSFAINGVIYSAWLGYKSGWVSILPQVFWCGGFIFLSIFAKRLGFLSRTGTLHGNIGYIFGKSTGYWAAFASLIGFTLLFGWELSIGANMFKTIIPNSTKDIENGIYFSLACITALYCMLGGIRGNLNANIFQNYLGGITIIVATIYFGFKLNATQHFSWNDFVEKNQFANLGKELTTPGIISNILLFTLIQFLDMSNWENIASITSSEKKGPKYSLWLAAAGIFIFPGVIGSALGMTMRTFRIENPDNLVLQILNNATTNPYIFFAIIIGFFAIMLSTVDGYLLAAAQTASWDLFDRKRVLRIFSSKGNPEILNEDSMDISELKKEIENLSKTVSNHFLEKYFLTIDDDKKTIIKKLNQFINDYNYSPELFINQKLSKEVNDMVNSKNINSESAILNRLILEDLFPNSLAYSQFSQIMRKEKLHNKSNWKLSKHDLIEYESKAIRNVNLIILGIALIGGALTLGLIRMLKLDSFNLIFVAYVAQMALFPSVWSIIIGNKKPHKRSAYAIGIGLLVGLITIVLGFTIMPQLSTWSPVFALLTATIIHFPFKIKN
jgi:hypothetical protein